MEENIVDQIRIDRLQKIHGFRFVAVGINKLMVHLGKMLYKRGYLSEIAEIDALTGLFNRNFFERWIDVIASQSERSGVDIVVVVVDVDGLKKRNDTLGHAAGDKMIKTLAGLFLRSVRKSDVVIRMGGDEFLLVLWDCSLEGAENKVAKILEKAHEKEISFSYGLALIEKGEGIANKIEEADEKMYEMKNGSGKGRV